jgi:hypothetical protein
MLRVIVHLEGKSVHWGDLRIWNWEGYVDIKQRSNRKMGKVVIYTLHQILDYYGWKTKCVICVECVLRTEGEATCISLWFSISKILLHEGRSKRIFRLPRKSCLWKRWKLLPSHYAFTSLSPLSLIHILLLVIWNQVSWICLERLRKRREIRSVQPGSRPSINLHKESWERNFHSIVFGITLCYFRLLSKICSQAQHLLHKNLPLITIYTFRLKIFYLLLFIFCISPDDGCLGPKQVAYFFMFAPFINSIKNTFYCSNWCTLL